MLEVLYDNNRLPNQLLLSSELGSFEDHLQKSLKINQILMKSSILKIYDFGDFWHGGLQMDLTRSSKGVDCANGYCHIVFRACATR